jgi:hypothetical protein
MAGSRLIPEAVAEWWSLRSEMQRDIWRMTLIILGLGGLVAVGWYVGKPMYVSWRQGTALEQVEQFSEQDDYRNALLALRRATQSDPSDPRVWRKAAEFLARIGSPEVVVAQRNLTRLDPNDVGLKVALVTESLRFNDLESAAEGLVMLEEGARQDAAFHRLAAAVALALGESDEMVAHLEALVEMMPQDYAARFNLAAMQVWSTDEDEVAAAGVELARLCTQPEVRVRAALERLKLAAVSRRAELVDQEVAFLVRTFDPRLGGLPLLRTDPNEPAGWSQLIDQLKTMAANDAADAALLARWLADIGLQIEALNWIEDLDEPILADPRMSTTLLDIAAQSNDLSLIRETLESGRLGRIPSSTIALAIAARVQAAEVGTARAQATWADAVNSSATSLGGLRVLARLGGIWREHTDANLALEKIVELYPREVWACEALRVNYAANEEMDLMARLYRLWAPRVPQNLKVQTTWIMLGALRNELTPDQVTRAYELWSAAEDPIDPALVLAMVAATWRTESAARAEQYFERMPVGAERESRVLLWRAIVAADLDDQATLRYALRNLPREDLMTEEQQILTAALERREQRAQAAERRERARAEASLGQ